MRLALVDVTAGKNPEKPSRAWRIPSHSCVKSESSGRRRLPLPVFPGFRGYVVAAAQFCNRPRPQNAKVRTFLNSRGKPAGAGRFPAGNRSPQRSPFFCSTSAQCLKREPFIKRKSRSSGTGPRVVSAGSRRPRRARSGLKMRSFFLADRPSFAFPNV